MTSDELSSFPPTDQMAQKGQVIDDLTGVEPEDIGTDESITDPFDPTLIRITTKNLTVDLLIERLRRNEFNLAPDFQRKAGIWTQGAQSRLIESMLIRIPLPAFYIDASDDENWVVVDGLQRLTAMQRFVVRDELRLTDLEFLKGLNGKRYAELPRTFQRRVLETQVTVYLIDPGTPPEVKFNMFKRINTGGLPLSLQEIRHALNQGPVTAFLKELASSQDFLKATDTNQRVAKERCWLLRRGGVSSLGVFRRRQDGRPALEMFVLRYLAFSLVPYQQYRSKDFDSFLNDRMADINRMSDLEREALAGNFKEWCRCRANLMFLGLMLFESDTFQIRPDTQ